MKKLYWVLIFVLLIACTAYISYSRKYTITGDRKSLEIAITSFGNNASVLDKDLDIKQELNIDDKKMVDFVFGKTLGYAQLTRGINNRYKIDFTEYGDNLFRDEIVKTNAGKYIILKGKNPDKKIAYTKAILDGKQYKIMIPDQEYFIVCCRVPDETRRADLDINNLKLFDKNDVDITKDMFKVFF